MAGHSCKECLKNGDKCPNVQYFHCIILYTLHVFIWINVRFRFNLLYFHPQSVKEATGARECTTKCFQGEMDEF